MWYSKNFLLKSTCILSLITLFPLTGIVQAQGDTLETPGYRNLDLRWHLEGSLIIGVGLKNHVIGKTNQNDDIKMSGGGGFGGNLMLGYSLSPAWDLGAEVSIQNSSLQPKVENASGSFLRTAISAKIKYRFPVSSTGSINIGGGAGYYMPNEFDIDASSVSGGAHNIYGYDNAVGFQLLGEYEGFFTSSFGWILGLKYYNVTYDLNSAKSNGIDVPLNQLPSDIKNELNKLDGSSVDLVLSLTYYF
jgi:hypothetical protein